MTHVGAAPVAAGSTARSSFVEWGAVLAGAVLAAALSFVLLAFGASIGLSAASPWPGSGASTKTIASLAIFWALAQQIGAFMAGGYVAGRMRARWLETPQHEVEFRDGLHGGLVWAVGVVIGAALFMATAGAATGTGAEIAGRSAASATASMADPMDLVLDTMLRPTVVAQAAPTPPPAGAAGAAAAARPRAAAFGEDSRAEVGRIIASSVANRGMTEPNRAYLVQLVAQRTGLPQAEAERRVNEAFMAAREAVDKARRATVLTGFVTAAALVLSFGAAWWAALKGGQHRDNSVPARFEFGSRQRRQGAPVT
jgi:hypothetical protein